MKKNDQVRFYKIVGKALTSVQKRRSITIAGLADRAGEQYKTIDSIGSGSVCSLHHAVWMFTVLGIDLNDIIREYMEGDNHGEEISRVVTADDLI